MRKLSFPAAIVLTVLLSFDTALGRGGDDSKPPDNVTPDDYICGPVDQGRSYLCGPACRGFGPENHCINRNINPVTNLPFTPSGSFLSTLIPISTLMSLASAQGKPFTTTTDSAGSEVATAITTSLSTTPTTAAFLTSSPSTNNDDSSISTVISVPTTTPTSTNINAAEAAGAQLPTTSTPSSTPHHSSKTPAIIGGVIGGLGGLALIALAAFLLLRKRRLARQPTSFAAVFEKTRAPSSLNTVPYSPPIAASTVPAPTRPRAASPPLTPYDPPPGHGVYENEPRTDSSAAMVPASGALGMRDVDDDGVSFRSASSTSPGLDGPSERGVPRLPIYPRGGDSPDGRSSSRALE